MRHQAFFVLADDNRFPNTSISNFVAKELPALCTNISCRMVMVQVDIRYYKTLAIFCQSKFYSSRTILLKCSILNNTYNGSNSGSLP